MEFYVGQFFSKNFPKISQKFPEIFSTFSKSKKTVIVAPKIVHNHYINQNLAKISLKTPKNSQFFPKNPKFFKIFGAFGTENLEFYVPKMWSFMSKRVPLGSAPPPKLISDFYLSHISLFQVSFIFWNFLIRDEFGGGAGPRGGP